MKLYHLTGEAQAESICRSGFELSAVDGAPERVWLCSTRQGAIALSSRAEGWLVIVEMPEDDTEPFAQFDDGLPYFDSYLVPIRQVNVRRPFGLERWR